jgi:glycine/D-amino acid oxidase-like deaminating enzyme
MQPDFLIIGQGLAGSLLGWELQQRGQQVLILDPGDSNASRIAAGLINPVTGQRLVKTDTIETLLPAAQHFYHELEQQFRKPFLFQQPMLRLLQTRRDREIVDQRLHEPDYQAFLQGVIDTSPDITSPFGMLVQKQTATLQTQPLLDDLRNFFSTRHQLIQTDVTYSDITPVTASWQNVHPRAIIFCEGHRLLHNPWFNWLPLQPVKGEIITAEAQQLPTENLLNYGHWMIPLDAGRFKLGATFDHQHVNDQPSPAALQQLLASLKQVCPRLGTISVVQQQAGIRPATKDRKPFIGFHPVYPKLAVFNGFGAKGSLLIPYYCRLFADLLTGKSASLPSAIDIKRHHATYFPA